MANINIQRYNEFINNSDRILSYITDEYMDAYEGRLLECESDAIHIDGMRFTEILEYRKQKDTAHNNAVIRQAMTAVLDICHSNGSACGFFIANINGHIRLFVGEEVLNNRKTEELLRTIIPELKTKVGFIDMPAMRRISEYGGVISGGENAENSIIDAILSVLSEANSIAGMINIPLPVDEIQQYINGLIYIKRQADAVLSGELSRATITRHTRNAPFEEVVGLSEYAKKRADYLQDNRNRMWKTCIWYGSESYDHALKIGSSIAGLLNANSNDSKARSFMTTDNPFRQGHLSLSLSEYGELGSLVPYELRKPSLYSFSSTDTVAGKMQLPLYSYNGINVIDPDVDESSVRAFPSSPDQKLIDGIHLGYDSANTELRYVIPYEDINEHVLVTGATGSGKTNTVKKIIHGLSEKCPVCIIEPSKKEYWELYPCLQNMRVYSAGRDAYQLRLNPLEPEEGTIIANHIDSVMYAFSGAFEMEEPTRLALDGLIKYAYEKQGWNLSDVAYMDNLGRRYPTISDLQALLTEYCNERLTYGAEVNSNIQGSISNRLSSLLTGVNGTIVNTKRSLTGNEICNNNTLIELDDLTLETKPFISMLILIKMDQYLRQRGRFNSLRNAVVLEEAHNIFARDSGGVRQVSKKMASDFFSNMLSQIRAYGVGIIIADQGASQINQNAISNTKIKITHAVTNAADCEEIAYAGQLSDYQKKVLPTLKTGQAAISVRGEKTPFLINVDKCSQEPIKNVACVTCSMKLFCEYDDIKSAVDNLGPRVDLYTDRLYECRFSRNELKRETANIAKTLKQYEEMSGCIAGYILSVSSNHYSDMQIRRLVGTLTFDQ